MPKKHNRFWQPGLSIQGKWHHRSYTIKRELGSGAIGSVYLCSVNGKDVALKISDNTSSMMMEVNVLKSLSKVQGHSLGPSLLDVDDWIAPDGNAYSFYAMEYIHGEKLPIFIKKNGSVWLGVFMLQLLDDLEHLHQAGWVFGDLKTENLLVELQPPRIRWVDVGGTTKIGRAIKEYTEFYDRGFWNLGTRRAEPSYDLFAFVMIFISIYHPRKFDKGKYPKATILKKIDDIKALTLYRHCLKKAILGKYQTSAEMKQDVRTILYNERRKDKRVNSESSMLPFIVELISIGLVSGGFYISSLFIPF